MNENQGVPWIGKVCKSKFGHIWTYRPFLSMELHDFHSEPLQWHKKDLFICRISKNPLWTIRMKSAPQGSVKKMFGDTTVMIE